MSDQREPLPARIEPPRQGELFQDLGQLIDLERQRIDSQNRRTDLMLTAIKAQDEADQRQHDFMTKELDARTAADIRRHGMTRGVLMYGGLLLAAVLAVTFGMAFFGNDAQREIALEILKNGAIALGGAGVFKAALDAWRRLRG